MKVAARVWIVRGEWRGRRLLAAADGPGPSLPNRWLQRRAEPQIEVLLQFMPHTHKHTHKHRLNAPYTPIPRHVFVVTGIKLTAVLVCDKRANDRSLITECEAWEEPTDPTLCLSVISERANECVCVFTERTP